MDNRLLLAALFMMLSWELMSTNAQTTVAGTTLAGTGNETTATGNETTATGNPTTATGNETTATGNATTSTGNPTTATGNSTTATGNATTDTGNATTATGNQTTTGNATTMAPTPPPLPVNTTVTILETPVSRVECGTRQLCAAQPASCDPSTPGSCFFLGARLTGGLNFEFQLSGESEGYLAASLSAPGINETLYVCANNQSVVRFISAVLYNDQLIEREQRVNNVKGKVNGKTIQCTFAATVPTPTSRATGFALAVSTGSFDATSGALGRPSSQIRTPVVNLEDPRINVTNTINTTTTTTQPSTTPVVPLSLFVTAGPLASSVSTTGCRSTKLCAAEPSQCDPSNTGSCFFLSAALQSGQTFRFQLSGQSGGYLAASLATSAAQSSNITTYICAKSNSSVNFVSALLSNNQLTAQTTNNVSSVNGSASGDKIQCEFVATVPDTSTRASLYSLIVSTGAFNPATGVLGNPTFKIRTAAIDLTNVNSTVTNLLNHAVTQRTSLMQVLLVTLVSLALMKL
ncbi:mucin-5AC isoform X2 [Parambassis ranga]|uniref:Mucin-5AC isoform X2 n=1 Tax=Parambassis ranga TaxID=210632 RepID=A0A6P7IAB3_9TELE|nr:mucin-5AC-like isoform X2 [Parambassis ranga]